MFGYFQPDHSGYINPRTLVRAQLVLAQSYGCSVIRSHTLTGLRLDDRNHVVIRSGVSGISRDCPSGEFVLSLMSGGTIRARKVLLATGAFVNISGIIKDFVESDLDLTLTSQTVAFLRVSESEARVGSPSPPLHCILNRPLVV